MAHAHARGSVSFTLVDCSKYSRHVKWEQQCDWLRAPSPLFRAALPILQMGKRIGDRRSGGAERAARFLALEGGGEQPG